jgi:hypothetical protein
MPMLSFFMLNVIIRRVMSTWHEVSFSISHHPFASASFTSTKKSDLQIDWRPGIQQRSLKGCFCSLSTIIFGQSNEFLKISLQFSIIVALQFTNNHLRISLWSYIFLFVIFFTTFSWFYYDIINLVKVFLQISYYLPVIYLLSAY